MWTHSDVAVLLKAAQTANLLQQEEITEPRPGAEALLDRWERVVDAFIAEPGPNGWTAHSLYARAR
jgi:hypothetical protein